jgi:hypothetical protein
LANLGSRAYATIVIAGQYHDVGTATVVIAAAMAMIASGLAGHLTTLVGIIQIGRFWNPVEARPFSTLPSMITK